MTMRILLVAFLALLGGCASAASGQATGARRVDERACVAAARTDGDTPAGAAAGCRSITVTSPAWSDVWDLHLCGPCNFAYDDATTRRERAAGHATDCCYVGRSPGPPLPAGGPHS